MKLRFTCFDLLVTIWLLLIKDKICHALKLKIYLDGVTAIDASDQCGTAGLENDPLVLNQIPELNGKEFWTGLGIYTPLTPWIETVGCFLLRMPLSTVSVVPSVGLCQHKCLKGYFTYNKVDSACSCLNITDKQLTNGTNLSSCFIASTKTVLIYKTFTGAVITFEATDGLCTTLTCIPPYAAYLKAAPCKGVSTIKGLCEDGSQSTSYLWSLSYNETRENCWNKNKLLLNSNACEHFTQDLTARAWTNIFREQIELEQPLGDRTAVPKLCLSANITDKGENILNVHRQNCLKKLKWFVCKNDSTKVWNTYHTDVATDSNYDSTSVEDHYRIDAEKDSNYGAKLSKIFPNPPVIAFLRPASLKDLFVRADVSSNKSYSIAGWCKLCGAIIGGMLGAISMIAACIVLIVCKIRSKRFFKESSNYEDTRQVNFAKTIYEDLNNTRSNNTTTVLTQTYGHDETRSPVYEDINESEKQKDI